MSTPPVVQGFFVAGGTLWREAPSYIVRPADDELFKLALGGEYCNVLAARQMGKSSLMVRTANRLQETGVRTAILDISTLGGGISTPEAWFFGFLDELALQLALDVDLDAWWEAHANLNAVQRFSNFLRDIVLGETQNMIAVFVDEIDSALGMAFTDDFFAAIRAAYNARASQPEFQRLTFILLGVARPADLIRDRNRTPYNIGAHIHLSGFSITELQRYQEVIEIVYPGQGRQIVEWVLAWTNGQPYLTQKICAELILASHASCTPDEVERTVTRLFFGEEARKESNLRAIRDRIESSPHTTEMIHIYAHILRGRSVPDEERSPAKIELKLTGLVRASDQGNLEVSNRIYRTVFDRAWVQKNLPQARLRQVAILASFLAVISFIIAGVALYQKQIQPSLTYVEQFENSNSPDVKLTSLARLLELDDRPDSQAYELYASLSQTQKLALFTELSSPQNVAPELVTVIKAVYQQNKNDQAGSDGLTAMKDVLGQIGAPGAPGLKTEIEFWLKGRMEADFNHNLLTAISFYDSAWAESLTRMHPNYAVRYDRAIAFSAIGMYENAYQDLSAVWEQEPARQGEIEAFINANPGLGAYISGNPGLDSGLAAFVTPVLPTATSKNNRPPRSSATIEPAFTQTPPATASLTPTAEQPSPYTGWIAFGYGEGSSREITIMNPVNGARRQITFNGYMDEAPSFSPDNWKLVYASNRSQDGWELYVYDLRKNTEQQLTSLSGQAHFPVWSPAPGDNRIVFEGRTFDPAAAINIWLVDAATGEIEQLTDDGADSRPAWAPDGDRIVFGRALQDTNGDGRLTVNDSLDMVILDLDSGAERVLANTPAYDDFNFAWSPDGTRIAFTSVRIDANHDGVLNLGDSQDLFVIDVDGGDERRLDLEGKQVFSPVWTPAGRFIWVLVAYDNGETAIWRFDTWNGGFAAITEPGPYHNLRYSNLPQPNEP